MLIAGLAQLLAAAGVHLAHRPPDWASPALAETFRSGAVQDHGWLSVRGTQLVDERGAPLVLRGVSLHGPQWFPPTRGWTVPSAVRMFGLNVVRIPAYVHEYSPRKSGEYWGGYLARPERTLRRVHEVVDDAIEAGVYVIIDWHIQSPPGPLTDAAVAFFDLLSRAYGRYPNVIYEIANEPVGVKWPQIKRYAERVIPVIRANAPDSIIIVGTPAFSKDIAAPVSDPLDYEGLLYALHFYAANHPLAEARSRISYVLNAGLPVIVSEWGPTDALMTETDFEAAAEWVAYMEAQRLSWMTWSLSNKDERASLLKPGVPLSGPWTEADLTEVGRWMLPRLRGPADGAAVVTGAFEAPTPAGALGVSVTTVDFAGSPEAAAEQVRLAGGEVPYWEVGLERDALPEATTAASYGARVRAFVEAMKAADPSVRVGAVWTVGDYAWNARSFRRVADVADAVCLRVTSDKRNAWSLFKATLELQRLVERLQTHALPSLGGSPAIWVTRWGAPDGAEARELARGLWAADFLGALASAGVTVAAPSGGGDEGEAPRLAAAALQGMIYPSDPGHPSLSSALTRTPEGRAALLLINKSAAAAVDASLQIPGFAGVGQLTTLSEAAPAPRTAPVNIDVGHTLHLPPYSLTLITLDAGPP